MVAGRRLEKFEQFEQSEQFVMANWAQVKEGLSQVSTQLASGTVTTAEVLKNAMPYMAAMADLGIRMENDYAKLNMQTAAEFGEVRQKVLVHQGAIEVLTAKPVKSHTGGARGILENKSVSSLPTLGTDKNLFRNWNDRMVNVVASVRPGSRTILQAMMEYVDQEIGGNFEESFKKMQEYKDMEAAGTTYESIDEVLYTLLTDHTEGEAALRVRGCTPGMGCKAYMTVYKWFMGVSGQAVTERMKKIMSPTTPKSEAEIADAIERWVEAARVLEGLKPEYKLPEPYKITALESLMNVGQGKLHFETLKAQDEDFDELLQKCRDYALRRRLESNHRKGKDDMDVDEVEDPGGSMDAGGRHWGAED